LRVRTFLERTAGIPAAICIALAIGFLVYDLRMFQPRRSEIEALIAAAHPLERSPPPMLIELHRADPGSDASWQAAWSVLVHLDERRPPRADVDRMNRAKLWTFLLRIHLSEADRWRIVHSRTYMGEGAFGFQAGALGIFGKPLDRLTDLELAGLIVISHRPRVLREPRFAAHVERGARELLERVSRS
jgi:hypothetical protein